MDLKEEKNLWQRGFRNVVGLDEAGRGAWAGPVVAAAVTMSPDSTINLLPQGVKDSKKLSRKKREELYEILIDCPLLGWGIGWVGAALIDRSNILEATRLAMRRALGNLQKKLGVEMDFLILDGNFGLAGKKLNHLAQKSIIKADEKVFSCAAASIIAKVRRDRMMRRYHLGYPDYGFNQHQGYGTLLHRERLEKYQPCKIHRKTFKPVLSVLEGEKKNPILF